MGQGLLAISQGLKKIEDPILDELQQAIFEALEEIPGYEDLDSAERFRIRVAVLFSLHVIGAGPWVVSTVSERLEQQRLLAVTQQALSRAVEELAHIKMERLT